MRAGAAGHASRPAAPGCGAAGSPLQSGDRLLCDTFGAGIVSDPARGTAKVLTRSDHLGQGGMQLCIMYLAVRADGMAPTAVEHGEMVHARRWPETGTTLPITVDRDDPRQVQIEWDDMPGVDDRDVPVDDMDEQLDRLSKLTELRNQGALTAAEFEAQKRRVLGG